jgi:hypothetical protein
MLIAADVIIVTSRYVDQQALTCVLKLKQAELSSTQLCMRLLES